MSNGAEQRHAGDVAIAPRLMPSVRAGDGGRVVPLPTALGKVLWDGYNQLGRHSHDHIT